MGLQKSHFVSISTSFHIIFHSCSSLFARKLPFQCVEKASRSNCPVCQEDLHTSREPCQIPRLCGHLIHKSCFENLVANGLFYCPLCSKSLLDLSPLWMMMKKQIQKYPLEGKYKVCLKLFISLLLFLLLANIISEYASKYLMS